MAAQGLHPEIRMDHAAAAPSSNPAIVDIEAEVDFWRDQHARHAPPLAFSEYEPAIRLGIQACLHAHGRSFDEVGPELANGYLLSRSGSSLDWEGAKHYARASWERLAPASEPG